VIDDKEALRARKASWFSLVHVIVYNSLTPLTADVLHLMQSSRARAWQKFVQRIAAVGPVSRLLARTLYRVDRPLLKLTNGRVSLASLLAGLPVVMLTTTGAKSGQPRVTAVVGIADGDKLVLVASYYGDAHQPAWYYNLRAHPVARVTLNGQTRTYRAREATDEERDGYWQRAVQLYAGFAAYQQRARRKIPIMVLTLA